MSDPPVSPPSAARDLPVDLDVTGWRCLVVGGGPVAARRTAALVSAGAIVTVVAPTVGPALEELAVRAGAELELRRRAYRSGEAAGYQLVGTATDRPEVDAAVVADATAAGVLVTSADRATPGTVHLPAVHRSGPVTVAVSTAGTSPALASWLRDRLAACLPPELPTLAALLDEARAAARAAGRPTAAVDWGALLDHVVPMVAAGRMDEARALLTSAALGDRPGREGPSGAAPRR